MAFFRAFSCGFAIVTFAVAAAACASSAATTAPPPSTTAEATPSGAPSESAAVTPTPIPPPSAPPSAVASAQPSASAPATPTTVFKAKAEFSEPKFEGGDVPKAKERLEKLAKAAEKCVDTNGGLAATGATIKIQFLVRAAGIAEGVDVLEAKGLEAKPGKCVRDVFKKKAIGTPSSDPVGVTFTITFSPKDEAIR
jgi:hypothetical protein